jgi:uncharacterized membrane protein YGL010W
MFKYLKKALRILVNTAQIIAILVAVFSITVDPVLVGGLLIGLAIALIVWAIIVIESKMENENR